jgi:5-methylcytosine-specific restriction enzyme A
MTRLHNKSQWHRRARRQLQKEPLCAMCLAEGKVIAARVADHIEPHHNDPVKF